MKNTEHLTEKSKAIWKDIERLASRKLNKADHVLIELFCQEIDAYDQAVQTIRDSGIINEHNQVHPAVTVRNQAGSHIRHLSKQIAEFTKEEKLTETTTLKSVKGF